MQSWEGRGVYVRSGDEKETSLGRANGRLRGMSCFINSSLTEEGLKLARGYRAGSGRAGIQI